ncbi:MAG TPA: S-layer homology domain-containing protein [Bacillota bacterium]|nr:S-layer homology domain-containing protein [Bacillota bacterium]
MRTKLLLFTAIFLILAFAAPAAGELPERGAFYSVTGRQTETISEGVTLTTYTLTVNGRPVRASVIKIDLNNPYVKIENIIGANGTLEKTQPVMKMAERSGAVAAVNGGFFIQDQGKPLGMIVRNGELVSSPVMRSDMPVFALDGGNRPLMGFYTFSGEVKAANGAVFPLFGVNKLLYSLENGQVSDTEHLTLYDRNWGPVGRGDDGLGEAVEAVVVNGTVTRVVNVSSVPQPIPAGGYLLRGYGKAADFIRKNLTVGSKVKVAYQTSPDYRRLKLSTGSNSFLVQNGKVARFQENLKGANARTAAASAGDGKVLYLVSVEKSNRSAGVEQTELAQLLVAMGAQEAVNLDGGGSTAMVARHLGDTALTRIIEPKDGWQRSVPDAIGIFNTAPRGNPAGLIVDGPDTVLAGTTASYTVKGYDSHFHPWRPESLSMNAVGGGSVTSGGVFTAGSGGDVVIEASSGGVKGRKNVHVVGASQIKALHAEPSAIKVEPGQSVSLAFSVETLDGRVFPLDAKYVSVRATTGRFEGGRYIAGENKGTGRLEASYLNFTVQVPVQVGSLFSDVENNWAAAQINELAEAGIIKGYEDGTFRPAEPVTRAQVVTLLARLLGWTGEEAELSFADEIPSWAGEAVAAAVSRGIVKGYPDGRFLPGRPVTRSEISVILANSIELPPGPSTLSFKDAGSVPAWAREAVGRVVSAGIIRGYEGNLLKPEANLTRAEMAVLIKRLIGLNYVKVDL